MTTIKSGDIYMSNIGNFHLVLNERQYVHLVVGNEDQVKQVGVDYTVQNIEHCFPYGGWTFICNIGVLLCTVTEQECVYSDTLLRILNSESTDT